MTTRDDDSFEPDPDAPERRKKRERKRRIKASELGLAQKIDLAEADLIRLHKRWNSDDIGDWDSLRVDIEGLAQEFLAEARSSSSSGPTRTWHHLLLAVGNFKRQAGVIEPAILATSAVDTAITTLEFDVPGIQLPVARDDAGTWFNLERVRGLGVPTATTLLSALWPGHHLILDRRDIRATVGIGPAKEWSGTELDDAWLPEEYDWSWYGWLRDSIQQTSALTMVEVERALYVLDRLTQPRLGDTWQWHDYSTRASEALDTLRN